MKALSLKNQNLTLCNTLSQPRPASDEALLKIRLAGICGTDLALLKGYADFCGVPGHEFVAEVLAVGDGVNNDWLGKRVVAEINQWCGKCEQCLRQQYRHCQHRRVIGIREHQGAFAEWLVVKVNSLHLIPDRIDDRQAVFIEPLAAAFRIVEQLQFHTYQEVLLVGAGRLGQLIARVMALQEKEIKIVARYERQRALLQRVAASCIDETEVKPKSADVTIDATGGEPGLLLALKATRPQGVCVMKSSFPTPLITDLTQLVIDEIQLMGSRCGDFTHAIAALEKGAIETESLIDGTCLLEDYQAAFTLAQKKGAMKVLIKPR